MDGQRLAVGIGMLAFGGLQVWLWWQDRRGVRRHLPPGFNRNWLLGIAVAFLLNGAFQVLRGLLAG